MFDPNEKLDIARQMTLDYLKVARSILVNENYIGAYIDVELMVRVTPYASMEELTAYTRKAATYLEAIDPRMQA